MVSAPFEIRRRSLLTMLAAAIGGCEFARVKPGQVLALLGNSGNSTESHLHFHICNANSPLGSEGWPYAPHFESLGKGDVAHTGNVAGFEWKPSAAPSERHSQEQPLQNTVERFL